MKPPRQGEIWIADFEPVTGHEQGGRRPALVLSVDGYNSNRGELVITVPLTRRHRSGMASRVPVEPQESGLGERSSIICDQIRTLSVHRLESLCGSVTLDTMRKVNGAINRLINLNPGLYNPRVRR